jgi:hypothetical protein
MDFMDKAIYEEAEEKVERREKWWEAEGNEKAIKVETSGRKRESKKEMGLSKENKKSNKTSVDSDDDFDKIYEEFLIEKSQHGSPGSNNK